MFFIYYMTVDIFFNLSVKKEKKDLYSACVIHVLRRTTRGRHEEKCYDQGHQFRFLPGTASFLLSIIFSIFGPEYYWGEFKVRDRSFSSVDCKHFWLGDNVTNLPFFFSIIFFLRIFGFWIFFLRIFGFWIFFLQIFGFRIFFLRIFGF